MRWFWREWARPLLLVTLGVVAFTAVLLAVVLLPIGWGIAAVVLTVVLFVGVLALPNY